MKSVKSKSWKNIMVVGIKNNVRVHPTWAYRGKWAYKGQSLVEVALFLPIFLILLAGLIEVSQLAITLNRVNQAARVGSRFGSAGGQDAGMVIAALNSITQTLQMSEDQWDMWVVRGTLDSTGTSFVAGTWEFNHVYGISNTVQFASIDENAIQTRIINDLNKNNISAADIQIIGMYALHDVESILNLDGLEFLSDWYTIRGFNFMRQTSDEAIVTEGCTAFPIAVNELIRSVTPPGQGGNPYPDPLDFDNPNPPVYGDFPRHEPDRPLQQAREGYVYRIDKGFNSGEFGWLTWNNGISAGANTLQDSLTWPGNSFDYANNGDSGTPATPIYPYVVRGYVNPNDTSDLFIHEGDWITAYTGSEDSAGVRSTIDNHIARGRQLRLPIWDTAQPPGGGGQYQIAGHAIFRPLGYQITSSGSSWILLEFIRRDESCGQPS